MSRNRSGKVSRVGIKRRCHRGNGRSEEGRVEAKEGWGMNDRVEVHKEGTEIVEVAAYQRSSWSKHSQCDKTGEIVFRKNTHDDRVLAKVVFRFHSIDAYISR